MSRIMPKDFVIERYIICKSCENTIGYNDKDVIKENYSGYGGRNEGEEYLAACPGCNKRIIISSW